ncbi:cytochrome P450 [Streptomyces melanogenes]|uniref:cytochrome P450 n=1 Tax=Streptomyces melanogenes TaxID=67326 RepID=UPI0037B97D93
MAASWRDGQVIDVNDAMMTLVGHCVVPSLFALHLPPRTTQAIVDDCTIVSGGILRRLILPVGLARAPLPANLRYDKALARLRATVSTIISDRRADATDHGDLLSALLHALETGEADGTDELPALADAEVTDQILTFLLAGIDTSAAHLAWALYELRRHPHIQEQLHRRTTSVLGTELPEFTEIPRLTAAGRVVTETLRRHAPTWMYTRTTTRDTELAGTPLKPGTTVLLSPHILHNRPDLYPEPDRFDPDRWQERQPDRNTYLPFGTGARKCIGDRFAENMVTLALALLTTRWQFTALTTHPARPSGTIVLTPRNLRLRITARQRPACFQPPPR